MSATAGRSWASAAGWLEREHDAFGIEFDGSMGERLDRMDEAIVLIRRLLDGERFDHEGRFYRFHDAWLSPRPIQAHLPILIGGSGPNKTLRTLARHADLWNEGGDLATMLGHDAVLRRRCAEVGRDPESIERTLYCHVVLRDDPAEARRVHEAAIRVHGLDPAVEDWDPFLGSPEVVADGHAAVRRGRLHPPDDGLRRAVRPRDDRPRARAQGAPGELSLPAAGADRPGRL